MEEVFKSLVIFDGFDHVVENVGVDVAAVFLFDVDVVLLMGLFTAPHKHFRVFFLGGFGFGGSSVGEGGCFSLVFILHG